MLLCDPGLATARPLPRQAPILISFGRCLNLNFWRCGGRAGHDLALASHPGSLDTRDVVPDSLGLDSDPDDCHTLNGRIRDALMAIARNTGKNTRKRTGETGHHPPRRHARKRSHEAALESARAGRRDVTLPGGDARDMRGSHHSREASHTAARRCRRRRCEISRTANRAREALYLAGVGKHCFFALATALGALIVAILCQYSARYLHWSRAPCTGTAHRSGLYLIY